MGTERSGEDLLLLDNGKNRTVIAFKQKGEDTWRVTYRSGDGPIVVHCATRARQRYHAPGALPEPVRRRGSSLAMALWLER